jgi:hypothetical protein
LTLRTGALPDGFAASSVQRTHRQHVAEALERYIGSASRLEQRAWALASQVLTVRSWGTVRDAIATWHASHPEMHEVAFIRLEHLGGKGSDTRFEPGTSDSLLGAFGPTLCPG